MPAAYIESRHPAGRRGARAGCRADALKEARMIVASHLEKIRKLEALRARLDPLEDFELWFWSAMNAGTHAVKAALHHAGITRADDVFPTQPGVYLVPQPDATLRAAFHPLGDILHVGRPKVEGAVPEEVARVMRERGVTAPQ